MNLFNRYLSNFKSRVGTKMKNSSHHNLIQGIKTFSFS